MSSGSEEGFGCGEYGGWRIEDAYGKSCRHFASTEPASSAKMENVVILKIH
jgi:hypothetical protein